MPSPLAASSVVTYLVQSGAGATAALADVPFGVRAANAAIATAAYLGLTLWPAAGALAGRSQRPVKIK